MAGVYNERVWSATLPQALVDAAIKYGAPRRLTKSEIVRAGVAKLVGRPDLAHVPIGRPVGSKDKKRKRKPRRATAKRRANGTDRNGEGNQGEEVPSGVVSTGRITLDENGQGSVLLRPQSPGTDGQVP